MLNKFSEAIRTNLTKIQRLKIVGLVTIEVHARDIIEKLIKSGCNDVTAFEWLSQLRVYWDRVSSDKPAWLLDPGISLSSEDNSRYARILMQSTGTVTLLVQILQTDKTNSFISMTTPSTYTRYGS